MRKSALKMGAMCLLGMAGCAAYAQSDWSLARRDARNTAYTAQEIAPPLKAVWRVSTYTNPGPTLLASGGVVCVVRASYNNEKPETLLIDRSGKTRWRLPNADPLYLKGDTLIVMRKDGAKFSLQRLNWKTKKRVWTYPFKDYILWYSAQATPQAGHLYLTVTVTDSDRELQRLICFDIHKGALVALFTSREYNPGGDFAIDGERIYWKLGHIGYILKAQTLEEIRQYNEGGHGLPMVVGDRIIGQQGMQVYATDRHSRKAIWIHSAYFGAAHALVRGKNRNWLIVESLPPNGTLAGIDVRNGKIVWRYALLVGGQSGFNDSQSGGLAAGAGSLIYVPGWREHPPDGGKMRGGFYCFDGATGKLRWQAETRGVKGMSIIVSEGSIYALDNKGFLSRFVSARMESANGR
jgi:outer membrane protein assembly factor BamB